MKMTRFELEYEISSLVAEQETYIMEGETGAAEELSPRIDELCRELHELD